MKRKLLILKTLAFFCIANMVTAQWNPQPNWKDSYKVGSLCFCSTNGNGAYDHGIANKTVEINGTQYSVRSICEELKKHPQYRAFRNGDIPYNTIQCGNRPYNDAPDEPGCPGRVDIGSAGCNQIGPAWDMEWLRNRTIFNGNGGDSGGGNDGNADEGEIGQAGTGGSDAGQGPKLRVIFPTLNKRLTAPATLRVEATATDQDGVREIELKIDGRVVRKERVAPYLWNDRGQDNILSNLPIKNYLLEVKAIDNKGNASIVDILIYVEENSTGGGGNNDKVTIKGQSIGKYVSSENGTRTMQANRNNVGVNEQFIVESAGNGTVSFKGNNGKYVSSENGNKPMNCNRNAIGAWERFTLEPLGGDLYAIKGNNGKYVSHENGNKPINCNRNAIGAWEKFVLKGLTVNRLQELTKEPNSSSFIGIYPVPMISDDVNITITLNKNVNYSSVEIIDLKGNLVSKKNLGGTIGR